MTSRVQKGGHIFRPVIHARAREASAAPRTQLHDVQASARPSETYEQELTNASTRPDPTRIVPPHPVLTSQRTTEPAPSTPITIPHRQPASGTTPTPIHVQAPHINAQPPPSTPPTPTSDPIAIDQGASTAEIDKTRRKRKSSTNVHESVQAESGPVQKVKRSKRTTPSRRSRGPSLPPYDQNAHPGDELDPTVVTMATLCDDIGQGRVSSKAAEILSNHAAWKVRNKEKRARMRTLLELKKYGRENEDENQNEPSKDTEASTSQQEQSSAAVPPAEPTSGGEHEGGFDYTQGLSAGRFNVQVRIGPNGETIIDEESLVVDRSEVENTQDYTHIVESDTTKFVNSATYGKRYRGSRWSAEETERFYDALSQYGENYELIAYILPGRDRKSCKNKFKMEDKKNPARINYCLNNRVPVDMQTLSRMTGKDFSGPVPEIRAPPPRPVITITEDSGTTASEVPENSAQRKVKKGRSRNVEAEDGVVIVGSVEYET